MSRELFQAHLPRCCPRENQSVTTERAMTSRKRRFTLKEVSENDGREGRPVYIVFENTVYDVTESSFWQNGTHMNMHLAGVDLTDQLAAAPHFAEVFTNKRVKEVGELHTNETIKYLPRFMKILFRTFPILRRHPHPISVHFPSVYLTTAALFILLHQGFGNIAGLDFDVFAFVLLVLGVLSAAVSVSTGFLTLWVNYRFKKTNLVRWKIRLSMSLLGAGLAAVFLRATGIVNLAYFGWIYTVLILVLALLVVSLGYLGSQMVFPTKIR